METSNYNSVFLNPIYEDNSDFLSDGIYLWVMHWKNTPPHLACSENGRYYSLSTNGIKKDVDATMQFRILRQKNIPSFFVRIREAARPINAAFGSEFSLHDRKTSCLTPINAYFLSDYSNIRLVSDLLGVLKRTSKIISAHSISSSEGFCGIRNYTVEDVQKHIENLLHHEVIE